MDISLTIGLFTLKCTTQKFTHMTPVQLNSHLKPSWSRIHGLCCSIETWINHRLGPCQITTIKAIPYWDWKLSIPATDMGAGTNELLRSFCAGIIKRMFCQPQSQCKKSLLFTTTELSICWILVVFHQTWPTFTDASLMMQKTMHSRKEKKAYRRKFEGMLLVVLLLFLHAKQLLKKLL